MFPAVHLRGLGMIDRPRPRPLPENDHPLIHPALQRPRTNISRASTTSATGNDINSSSTSNQATLNAAVAAAAAAAASASRPSTGVVPMRPILHGLPLAPNSAPFSLGVLSAAGGLTSPNTPPAFSAQQLLQYPGLLPTSEELKYLSMAQIQAANQAHLAGEVAKLKPPFLTRNYLELAMLVCNTFRGKLFPCPHCRYVTDRRNNLKRHVATMHQACDKQLECCGVTFATKASLREHITIFHHNGYSCAYCGRRFCRKALLKRHLSVHSGQKDYTCPHCDYATSHKSNLERHKRIHARLQLLGASGLGDGHVDDDLLYSDDQSLMGHSDSPIKSDTEYHLSPTRENRDSNSRGTHEFKLSPEQGELTPGSVLGLGLFRGKGFLERTRALGIATSTSMVSPGSIEGSAEATERLFNTVHGESTDLHLRGMSERCSTADVIDGDDDDDENSDIDVDDDNDFIDNNNDSVGGNDDDNVKRRLDMNNVNNIKYDYKTGARRQHEDTCSDNQPMNLATRDQQTSTTTKCVPEGDTTTQAKHIKSMKCVPDVSSVYPMNLVTDRNENTINTASLVK